MDDGIATGVTDPKLRILGRPRMGCSEEFVLLEEPGKPVQMHYVFARKTKLPHMKVNCQYCEEGADDPSAYWYLGAVDRRTKEVGIAEITWKCWQTLERAALRISPKKFHGQLDLWGDPVFEGESSFVGLLARVSRGNFEKSPRILRCDQRVEVAKEWPYNTRIELAKIWGIRLNLRIYREETS